MDNRCKDLGPLGWRHQFGTILETLETSCIMVLWLYKMSRLSINTHFLTVECGSVCRLLLAPSQCFLIILAQTRLKSHFPRAGPHYPSSMPGPRYGHLWQGAAGGWRGRYHHHACVVPPCRPFSNSQPSWWKPRVLRDTPSQPGSPKSSDGHRSLIGIIWIWWNRLSQFNEKQQKTMRKWSRTLSSDLHLGAFEVLQRLYI